MTTHELKAWPEYFLAMWEGRKTFEARRNDRDYGVTDTLYLREWKPCSQCGGSGVFTAAPDPTNAYPQPRKLPCVKCKGSKGTYTGREMMAEVTYVMEGGKFGVEPGHVVMGLAIKNRVGGGAGGRYHQSAVELTG